MSKVSVGLATKLGLVKTALLAALAIELSIEHNQSLLTGSNKPAGVLACLSAVGVVIGRMYQGAHVEGGSSSSAILPEALQALAADAQANVAKVQASPDGTDSAQVPYSGAETLPPAQQG